MIFSLPPVAAISRLAPTLLLTRRPSLLLSGLLLLAGLITQAQVPTITARSPTRNARNAPPTTPVAITFSQPMSSGAATLGAVKVFSQQRGGRMQNGAGGTTMVSGNTLTFTPTRAFTPGETVYSTVTPSAQSSGGINLARGQVSQFTTAVGGTGRGNFTAPATNPEPAVGDRPTIVAVGDVDGDGDLDLLTANNNSNTVSVRLNDGAGGFTPHPTNPNPPVGVIPYSVAVGDVDGDGDLDFLTANLYTGNVSVRLNDGAGGFTPHPTNPETAVGAFPVSVALGDVDGDGDLDFIAANANSNNVSVRLNDGSGNFTPHSTNPEPAVGSRPYSVALGDVDGDGDLDFIAANSDSDNVSVRLNDGAGGFTPHPTNPETAVGSQPYSVALGDVDGDSDLDLLTANLNSDNVSVLLNDGAGGFTPPSTNPNPAVGDGPRSVALGDVDGDGDLDLLTSNANSGTVSVRLNQPLPVPPTITALSPTRNARNAPPTTTVAITFSQPMSNGAATLGALKVFSQQRGGRMQNGAGGTTTVDANANTLTFTPTRAFTPGETVYSTVTPSAQSSGGINLARGQVSQFTTAVGGTGEGNFTAPATNPNPAVGRGPYSVAVGDVDGDGDLDLVTANPGSDNVSVRLNDGAGNFTPPPTNPEPAVGDGPYSMALGDVDGDGDLDFIAANFISNTVSVRLNDGAGNFTPHPTNPNPPVGANPVSVALGDVDGDGDLDFITANLNNNNVSVRLNDGSGGFTPPPTNPNPVVGATPLSVVMGDVDGDGDLDFLAANASSNTVSVRLNDGAGGFTPHPTNPNPAVGDGPYSVALGDVDGDGDLDFLTANPSGNTVSVRLNDGSGNFTPPPTNPEPAVGNGPNSVALGDVDGDGDLDLLTANIGSDNVSVRLNDGSGGFTPPSTNPEPAVGDGPYSVALGDVDGDGDLDLLTANLNSNTVSVRLNQPPLPTIAGFAVTLNPVCVGSPITFTATVGNVSGSYNFTLTNGTTTGTGSSSSTAFSQTLTAATAEPQTFTLTVEAAGQRSSATTSLTANARPVASLSASGGGTLTCGQPSLTLTAGGGDSYAFSGPGLVSQDAGGGTAVVNMGGVYSVTVTNASGCTATAQTTVSQDNTAPLATLSATPSATLSCAQTSLTLTAGGGQRYAFSGPGLVSQNPTSGTAVANAAGVYSVTVTSAGGCTATQTTEVASDNRLAAPDFFTQYGQSSYPGGVQSVTVGQNTGTVTFQFSNCIGGKVNWTGQDGSSGTGNIVALTSQPGTLTYTGTCTLNRCVSPASSVTVTTTAANTPPVATANANQTATVGVAFSYTVAAFTDSETPDGLTYTASIDPVNDFNFNPATRILSGTTSVSGVSSVTVVGTDPGSLSASTSFTITVSPAASMTSTAPFAITGVTTIDCTPVANRINVNFNPRYAGLNGQSIRFQVVNELSPTTAPGPYTLQLYTDNPVITLKATQSGTVGEATFSYNWLAACNSLSMVTPNNTAPTTTGIANQSGTVNQGFTLNVASSFSDAETPNTLSYSATGPPAGLSLSGSTISGTLSASGVSTVTVTATDPGSLSVSASFTLTVSPATSMTSTAPFSITGVTTIDCTPVANRFSINFNPRYAGLNGQTIRFQVENELSPTTAPGPYSLTLYPDNPVITLRATQSGTAGEASFSYNWLAACNSLSMVTPNNTAPTTTGIANQSGTVNQGFTLNVASSFSDAETPNTLSYSATGLPAGLSLSGSTISGTPSTSGVSTVTVRATDPGSLSVSTSFTFTVSPASTTVSPPPSSPFSITGVSTVSCSVLSAGQRELRFTPQYGGTTGQPISFQVVNELSPTTAPGPYTLRLYTDNPVITLKATQSGTAGEASFSYNWLAACDSGSGARLGAEPVAALEVRVLGNPMVGEVVEVEVRGGAGQSLRLETLSEQGYRIDERGGEQAGRVEPFTLRVGASAGVYLLRVSSPFQSQTLKLLKK